MREFLNIFYHLWRLISSENASLLLFALWQDCLFSHKINFFPFALEYTAHGKINMHFPD